MGRHLFDRQGPQSRAKLRAGNCYRSSCRRGLTFESLEKRVLLDASGPLDSQGAGDPADDLLLAEYTRFTSPEQLEQYLVEDALDRYDTWFGQPAYRYGPWRRYEIDFDLATGTATTADMVFLSGESSHSETNTQVEGVDEGDVVETDGDFLYVLSGHQIVILAALPAVELHVVSRVEIAGRPFEQYLDGDRLTVLSRSPDYYSPGGIQPVFTASVDGEPPEPVPPTVTVTVLDVSDRQLPTVVQETELEGHFEDSRAVGNSVYLVLRNDFYLPPPERLPAPDEVQPRQDLPEADAMMIAKPYYWPEDGGYVYETEAQYLARIEGQVLDLALPHFSGRDGDGTLVESGLVSQATDIYQPFSARDDNLVSVVVFDTAGDTPGPVSSTSVPGETVDQVYMAADSLYLLRYQRVPGDNQTSILKFDLDETGQSLELSASGSVPGRVLNQFSIDQYDGFLRIATTRGWADSNNLYVLQQGGQSLDIVGRLEDLAPGEKIYSARFMGQQAFVVTFRQVDPLFAIDLSDPTDPQVVAELKVSGFSNYLHPLDGGYLIGVGRDADEETGLFQDPQVSLFDVGDLSDPQLLDRLTIPTGRAGGLPIFNDHHVIAYFPEYGVLTVAVPAVQEPQVGWGFRSWQPPQTDMWVFSIDADAGEIQLLGQIDHDTDVSRSVRINDLLYSVSRDTVTVNQLLDPQTQVAELHFGVQELGTLDLLTIDDLDLSRGDRWYRFQTRRPGLLTLEASGAGSVEVELYDAHGEPVGPPSGPRVDWPVDAGQTYSLRVHGDSDDSQLRVANVVQRDGSAVTVHGTELADRFEFDVATMVATLNGIEYTLDDGETNSVTFDGHGGADTAVLTGTGGDETVELRPYHGTLTGDALTVTITHVETITIYGGGGNDTAVLGDSAGDDRLVQWPSGSMLSGDGFTNKVHDFATVEARATAGGRDIAKVYDSPGNDVFLAKPGFTRLTGQGFLQQAEGFYAVHAFATAGGSDVAKLYDSAGDDTFTANSIGGALFGDGFYNRAKFFEGVHAYATAGGIDLAKLFDSGGDDTFHADPIQGALFGDGFYNRAKHFEGVHAYATAGGRDVARLLDSADDDIFYADDTQGALYRPGHYYNRAKHFEEVYAEASTGDDEARLNDSSPGDLLQADGPWVRLWNLDLDFLRQASQFDRVRAPAATAAGQRQIAAHLDFVFQQDGSS